MTKNQLMREWKQNGSEEALTMLAFLNVYDRKHEEMRARNRRRKIEAAAKALAFALGIIGLFMVPVIILLQN